jgi:ABC-type branched-subunit amino acid transport system ATPase component
MRNILKIENLCKSFDGVVPIKDVDFAINKQSIVLISGDNGAGKTTLFNLITGLEKPTNGKIIFDEIEIQTLSPLKIAQLGIVRLYQQPKLFKNLIVWENLVAAAAQPLGNSILNYFFNHKALKKESEVLKQKALDLLTKFNLLHLQNQLAGELSYGQQKLISFSMLAMANTKLALLDEPFAGLNPQTIEQCSNMILQMRDAGITFLIIEHNIKKALDITDFHYNLENGVICLLK